MKLVLPSAEVLVPRGCNPFDWGIDMLCRIEEFGRTCYKSEDKITPDSAEKFVKRILISGHHSVIEHESISVRIICDRGVTHELVRHRLAAYSQESMRYCDYTKSHGQEMPQVTFVIPRWLQDKMRPGILLHMENADEVVIMREPEPITWLQHMYDAEMDYNSLRRAGWLPQQASSVLPNSLKTEIVMTANIREWRHVLTLRTSKAAHPCMRVVAKMILRKFNQIVPVLFEDIGGE